MKEIKIDIRADIMSPLERTELVDNIFRCLVDTLPHRNDMKISIDINCPSFNGRISGGYGIDVSYRCPEVKPV